ncbi:hypothetical protein DUNSADRAFT_18410 [Dunaliella salina]|uniref:Thioredoxin domain-containing protein n=1 Tax=Dunaliella salina TaxID=3046 RepID=A0ABQ7GZ47_DUNSA|nr:hypothetical protein DUNSADRAFT_18410 [Dunaliella salina]|eukprot:KAF5839867.1 hypothetical protein DUNSADRAFT_18410 [Dunaliella salina]
MQLSHRNSCLCDVSKSRKPFCLPAKLPSLPLASSRNVRLPRATTGRQTKTIEIVDAEECQKVIQSHCQEGGQGELIVSFTAAWCGPCKLVAKELGKVLESRPKLRVLSMDIDAEQNKQFCGDLGIKALPTVLFVGRDPKKPVIASQGQLVAKVVADILDKRIHLSGADLKNRLNL